MNAASTVKRIVCLANSRKRGGRCVAGKELLPDDRVGGWIRPVSARHDEEVSPQERCYPDGADPQILDVIEVSLLRPHPKTYQQENWLLNPHRCWTKAGQVTWRDLCAMTDGEEPLWINGHSTSNGCNDRVPTDAAAGIDDSLRLIRVDALTVSVSEPSRPSADFPILRGSFNFHGDDYCFRITDPNSENGSLSLAYGDYRVGERYLCVSLGEPFDGYAYKLIATIIRP